MTDHPATPPQRRTRRRAITLMEIMIVIFLIGLIAGAIGYNMRGSLDEGRAFRTQAAIDQIRDILLLEVAKGQDLSLKEVAESPEAYLKASGIVKDPKKLLKDGWGNPLSIVVTSDNMDLDITSAKFSEFKKQKDALKEPPAKPTTKKTKAKEEE